MADTSDQTALLAAWLDEAKSGIAFTGAGISTESGIPDFRSPGGLWSKNQPIEFQDFLDSPEARKESWRRRFAIEDTFAAARPTLGHQVLADYLAAGALSHIVTQNIDNLHQTSGIPDDRIIELHGNTTYAACIDCSLRVSIDWVRSRMGEDEMPPDCDACGGFIKTATVSFGQPMPGDAMAATRKAVVDSDIFLAIGSSLVVYPAAGFPMLAKEHGATLVIINREATPLDPIADLVIHGEIGAVLRDVRDQSTRRFQTSG